MVRSRSTRRRARIRTRTRTRKYRKSSCCNCKSCPKYSRKRKHQRGG